MHLNCFFFFFQLLCSETDLRDLGVQFGPRKKIMSFLKDFAQSRKV